MNHGRFITAMILLLIAAAPGGCYILWPVAYFVEGPPTVDAE